MRTAIDILSEKKNRIYAAAGDSNAGRAWLNFLEAQMLMATVNALITVSDESETRFRLGSAVGRSAGLLLALDEKVKIAEVK